MNGFPKRTDTHIKETDSWKILRNNIPSEWLIREVSERDYGIDCYIELVNTDKEVTGDLLSGQLKGTERLDWLVGDDGTKEATFSGIKAETIHYWMNLPVPVFLFVADLTERTLYFAPVKQQVRRQYRNYLNQKSISFSLSHDCNFSPGADLCRFLAAYFLEKSHNTFVSALRTLFVHWDRYLEFIQYMQGLDLFLGAEPEQELMFLHIYLTLQTLSTLLAIDWPLESLADIIKKDRETWKDPYYMFHYQTFTDILPTIESKFFQIIQKTRDRITRTEKEYWKRTDLILYRAAERLEYLKPGYTA